jgi:hypothetical protein
MSAQNHLQHTTLSLSHLRCEYKENPIGIDVLKPRLSWQMTPLTPQRGERGQNSPLWGVRGARQTAYQIVVAGSLAGLEATGGHLWDSGKVSSGESIHRPYEGPALASSRRYCLYPHRLFQHGRSGLLYQMAAGPGRRLTGRRQHSARDPRRFGAFRWRGGRFYSLG